MICCSYNKLSLIQLIFLNLKIIVLNFVIAESIVQGIKILSSSKNCKLIIYGVYIPTFHVPDVIQLIVLFIKIIRLFLIHF